MTKPQKAQSIMEYCVITALIAAGIAIMGPYVIRSVNAYFKGWEDSIEDSVNDPLETTTAAIPRGCVCPFIPQSLGCGEPPCDSNQRTMGIECIPKGCDPKAESTPKTCQEDSCCGSSCDPPQGGNPCNPGCDNCGCAT